MTEPFGLPRGESVAITAVEDKVRAYSQVAVLNDSATYHAAAEGKLDMGAEPSLGLNIGPLGLHGRGVVHGWPVRVRDD